MGWSISSFFGIGDVEETNPIKPKNKRLTDSERFDSYTNNHIKRFAVNHYISKDPTKNMTLKEVEILHALQEAGLEEYTEHSIVDKIHLSSETYDDFIRCNHISNIHSIYNLSYDLMYSDVYIDENDRRYKSYGRNPITASVSSMMNIDYSDSDIYFAIIKSDIGYYGLVFRIVYTDSKERVLTIHPTKYILGRDYPPNILKFTAVEGLSQDELVKEIYNGYSSWADSKIESKDILELKIKKVNAYEMIGQWYRYIPHTIILEAQERIENGKNKK